MSERKPRFRFLVPLTEIMLFSLILSLSKDRSIQ